MYLLFEGKIIDTELYNKLITSVRFKSVYWASKDLIMLVFNFTQQEKMEVIIPFIQGKYSKMSDNHKQLFPHTRSKDGKPNYIHLVFSKSPLLREHWETLLDVKLPEDAEVWSKPEKETEIYRYGKV